MYEFKFNVGVKFDFILEFSLAFFNATWVTSVHVQLLSAFVCWVYKLLLLVLFQYVNMNEQMNGSYKHKPGPSGASLEFNPFISM